MGRFFAPRRIAFAFVICLAGLSLGATAASLNPIQSSLPERFDPAMPMGGDRAVYHMLRMEPDGSGWIVRGDEYPALQMEERGAFRTWNSVGREVVARETWQATAGFLPQGSGDEAPIAWKWTSTRTLARDAQNGSTVWIATESENVLSARGIDAGPVAVGSTLSQGNGDRRYVKPGTHVIDSCFAAPAPRGSLEGRTFQLPTCTLPGLGFDPADPPRTAGEYSRVAGYLLRPHLEPVGTAETDFGPAVIFEAMNPDGEASFGGMQFWYAESVPLPIQAVKRHADGTVDLLYLKHWTRGAQPLTVAGSLPPLPGPTYGALTPWGSIDTRLDAPFLPSEAWQAASAPGLDGQPSRLGQWLEDHGQAYTESFEGKPAGGGYAWSFQATDGHDRIAFTVHLERPMAGVPLLPADPRASVEYTTPREPDVPTEPPTASVRLESLSSLYQVYANRSANVWGMSWSCAELVWVQCEAGNAYGLMVGEQSTQSTHEIDQEAPSIALSDQTLETGLWIKADGTLAQFSTRHVTSKDVGNPQATPPDEAPQMFKAQPARSFDRAIVAASTGAAALLALLYLTWPLIKAGPLALFSRIRDDGILENPARQAIHDAVVGEPGIHVQELVRRTGYSRATVEHHVKKLVDAGRLRKRTQEGYTCLHPRRTDARAMDAAPVLRAPAARHILRVILEQPGVTGAELSCRIGKSRSTIAHHIARMRRAGLVEEKGRGMFPTANTKLLTLELA